MENTLNIVILAGGDIRNKFNYVKNNCSSPALIPMNTRPLAYYVLNNLNTFYSAKKFLVINDEIKSEVINELHETLNATNSDLLTVQKSTGVNNTLFQALQKLDYKKETIVLLVTTIPTFLPDLNEIVTDNHPTENNEWSLITETNDGELAFINKNSGDNLSGFAFSGYFRANTNDLIEAVEKSLNSNDLLNVVRELSTKNNLAIRKAEWIDCGHEGNFYEAKKKLINSRSFNSINITEDNRLIKKSRNGKKLKDEAEYIHALPESIKYYFPEITRQYSINDQEYAYEMTYFNVPNIAELMLYWNIEDQLWMNIFNQFDQILDKFKSSPYTFTIEQHLDFFLAKLKSRVDALHHCFNPVEISQFINGNLEVNGVKCSTFNELLPFIECKIEELYNQKDHCIMHGDFCFNNMLFDPRNQELKLIDARGSFSSDYIGIYGDRKYDLAKLMHSSIYGYDYLVNDLFNLDVSGNKVILDFNWRPNRKLLEKLTSELIVNKGFSLENIKFIVGLLFISMTPLHSESKNRQKAMYVHGLQILNEIYNGEQANLC